MTFLDTLYDVTHVYYTCFFFFFSSPYFSLSFFVLFFFFLLSWSNEGFFGFIFDSIVQKVFFSLFLENHGVRELEIKTTNKWDLGVRDMILLLLCFGLLG